MQTIKMKMRARPAVILAFTATAICMLYVHAWVAAQNLNPAATAPCSARTGTVTAMPVSSCTDRAPVGHSTNGWCLQQALWSKCDEAFMQGMCDASCSRCESFQRRAALQRTLLVSARQAAPCAEMGADAWVMRAMQNHANFAREHGMVHTFGSALVDANYEGAWNKVAFLSKLMRAALNQNATHLDWILWADWDLVFADLSFELPLEEYTARGTRLVVGGDPAGVGAKDGAPADYLKLNTGLVLLRVHPWSLALLNRMLRQAGRSRAERRRRALDVQRSVSNLCVGCIDDQAVLLEMLRNEPDRWAPYAHLERRFPLQGFFEDYAGALPDVPFVEDNERSKQPPASSHVPLRAPTAHPLAPLRRRVFGSWRVPLSVHFAGCQLCSGKGPPEKTPRCWAELRRTIRFAEDQAMRPLGLRHQTGTQNRSADSDGPLQQMVARQARGTRSRSAVPTFHAPCGGIV